MQDNCIICNKIKSKPKNLTCSRACATKYQWTLNPNADSRKQSNRERWKTANPCKPGARKGRKNKNPYPITDALLQKYAKNPPPSWAGKKHKEETKMKQSKARTAFFDRGGKITSSYKGKFSPRNPEKYKGNPTQIIYRSSLELSCMKYFDTHPQVISWSSEETIVPYFDKSSGKFRRYFPDFIATFETNGKRVTHMIEVKPYKQTIEPKKTPGKKRQTFLTEVMTYAKNYSKWEYAREYCNNRGWKFTILTEKEIRNG